MTRFLESRAVRLSDESGVGEARRAARRVAREVGLDQVATEHAAIVAVEASRNAVLHAGGGQLVLTPAAAGGWLDVLALDRGRGIADVQRAMEDGFSTAGSPGQGLGAIRRLSALFDIYSAAGKGTALFARVGAPAPGGWVEVGAVCVALASERECGDAWTVEFPDGRPVVLVADGLGHGPLAAEAARVAIAALRANARLPAPHLVERLHAALRPTRGAAVAVAEATGVGAGVRYAGVGNISGALPGSPHVRKMVSLPGTAGHEARTIRSFDYEWTEGTLLVMHTDGITSHWDLGDYPGLAQRHPALVAGILYRDFARPRDDATVVVVRRSAP